MPGTIESVGNLLGGFITSGGVGAVSSAISEGLKLINHLTEDDPVKQAKVRRQYIHSMLKIIGEMSNAENKDLTELITQLDALWDAF